MKQQKNNTFNLIKTATFDLKNLLFDPKKHEYYHRLSGKKLMSVSEIVNIYYDKDFSTVDQYILRKAQKRGINIHKFMEKIIKKHKLIDRNEFKEEKEILENFLESTKIIKNEEITSWSEVKLYNSSYAGTIDLITWSEKERKLSLYDLKTGRYCDWDSWQLQLNLYWKLFLDNFSLFIKEKELKIDLHVIWLTKNGKNPNNSLIANMKEKIKVFSLSSPSIDNNSKEIRKSLSFIKPQLKLINFETFQDKILEEILVTVAKKTTLL